MFRITKKSGDSVVVESDYGSGSDHKRAHSRRGTLTGYMDKHGMDSVEGKDYDDIKHKIWRKDQNKDCTSSALSDLGGFFP